jgi:hypothetical protein
MTMIKSNQKRNNYRSSRAQYFISTPIHADFAKLLSLDWLIRTNYAIECVEFVC